MTNEITEFQGAYRFLSNFWVEADGMTAEHEFQASKAATPEEAIWVLEAPSPGEAKSRGRRVTLRPDWEDIKIETMEEIVRLKFEDPTLREWLHSTGDAVLYEGNTWGDKFWGIDINTGEGENHLGQILMKIREENRF